MIANRSDSFTKTKRLWVWVVLIVAVMIAGSSVVTASAQAVSKSDRFPKQVLMKGETVLQGGKLNYANWHWYEAGEWQAVNADRGDFPRAVLVRAGAKLRVKINKPQRPAIFRIIAYKSDPEYSGWPIGKGQRLDTTLRRIKQDDRTVGWNVFFRVNESDRHYLLETRGRWERVPGTHFSYGGGSMHYHLKTL